MHRVSAHPGYWRDNPAPVPAQAAAWLNAPPRRRRRRRSGRQLAVADIRALIFAVMDVHRRPVADAGHCAEGHANYGWRNVPAGQGSGSGAAPLPGDDRLPDGRRGPASWAATGPRSAGLSVAKLFRTLNTACLRGSACGWSARTEWPVLGSRGTVLREAAGALVVALAARWCWFCYHQLFAVLLELERRRTRLAEMTALGRAFSWTRGCGC
jgi:hypothetical protein